MDLATDSFGFAPSGRNCCQKAAEWTRPCWVRWSAKWLQRLKFAATAGEIHRNDEARTLWHEVYGPLSEGRPGLAGALLGRAEAHVLRLALLYALLDHSRFIEAPHLMAALALWDYCERSVYYIFGDNLGDPVADEACYGYCEVAQAA